VDPTLFVRLLASAAEHDATPHLPKVDVPVLVIGGDVDTFTPLRLSKLMAEKLPDSRLVVIPGGTHVGILEAQELVATSIREFLEARVPVSAPAAPRARAAPAVPPLPPLPRAEPRRRAARTPRTRR